MEVRRMVASRLEVRRLGACRPDVCKPGASMMEVRRPGGQTLGVSTPEARRMGVSRPQVELCKPAVCRLALEVCKLEPKVCKSQVLLGHLHAAHSLLSCNHTASMGHYCKSFHPRERDIYVSFN